MIGKRLPRIDAYAKATGQAVYADDMTLPRMLFGKLLRSTQAHARIAHIDCSDALKCPGVIAVADGRELPVRYGILPSSQDETVFAIDKVRYVGEPIAAVVAEDELAAQQALSRIRVEYAPLPPIMTIEDGLRDDLPKIHEDSPKPTNVHKETHLVFGNVEAGFAAADRIFEDEYFYEGNTHAAIEEHAALAQCSDGKIAIWTSSQTPHYLHRIAASVLGVPAARVRIVAPFIGGGFGGKTEPFHHELAAAYLARKTGRPVKFTLTREEVFYAHRGRHPVKMKVKTGVKNDGTITACHLQTWLDGGAYGSYGVASMYYTGALTPVTYKLPAYAFDGCRVYTNKPPCGPKRGHGTPQPRFAVEAQLDKIADALGLDAAEYRKRIAVEPHSRSVNGLRITSCGLRECIDAVTARTDYGRKHGALPHGRGIGLAVSTYMCGAGLPIYWNAMPHSAAIVKADRGGGVTVYCGVSECGQGSQNMLAVIVAETLGIDTKDVSVCAGDTDLAPVDLGSYSSRVTFMAGNAARQAADSVRAQIDAVDPQGAMPFAQAVALAEERFGPLVGVGSYTPPKDLSGDYKGSGVGPSPAYSYSACIAEVSVDPETGRVDIEKITLAHDVGRSLNPTMVEGQIEGGVYMGVGEAFFEASTFRDVLHLTPNLLEYKTPTILDTPDIDTIIVETDDPEGPFGAKEVGQGPLVPVVPAVANAIADAIGVRLNTTPFTPERVLKALAKNDRALSLHDEART